MIIPYVQISLHKTNMNYWIQWDNIFIILWIFKVQDQQVYPDLSQRESFPKKHVQLHFAWETKYFWIIYDFISILQYNSIISNCFPLPKKVIDKELYLSLQGWKTVNEQLVSNEAKNATGFWCDLNRKICLKFEY